MTKHARSAPSWVHAVLPWLLGSAVGPALVALPVNWAAAELSGAAQRWFHRLRHTDDLSRLVKAATGTSVDLDRGEFRKIRQILEDEQTWSLLRRGPLEDLATRIASALPPRDDRTAKDSHEASFAIARGLLEFAVADLDPKLFQQILLARLQRLEDRHATALDQALLSVQADLVAGLRVLGDLGSEQFAAVMDHLKRVLDQLPPGPAGRGEIAIYLKTLIDWLDIDPWPRRFGSAALTPTSIERKLRVTILPARQDNLDADDLAQTCHRLVILGPPGSGKTWLTKRVARIYAENALKALAEDQSLDDIEFPLYTTCSQLMYTAGEIRHAIVSSAISQLSDLGGTRVSAALRLFFTERNAPTCLIIDSIDEALGSDERLRQADTMSWRIIVTSRPSSWNQQLELKEDNSAYRVGELRPLRYPIDVEAFIGKWFANFPDRGDSLVAQIRHRPDLRQAATIPLILAFYCVIGGSEKLPEFKHELYAKVIKRMLTGHWRTTGDGRINVEECLQTLQSWAYSGAISDHYSGLGMWVTDIPTARADLGEGEQDALDHIAAPIGAPDFDTGLITRAFIHRSICEHLVAEHVAGLPVDQAADALLPHIWYDKDWEFSAPSALARHPERDQLLKELIHRAAGSGQIAANISSIDGAFAFRGFLARVAAESHQAAWSPELAEIIGQARLALVQLDRADNLGAAVYWDDSNRRACAFLLKKLEDQPSEERDLKLVDTILGLYPTQDDKQRARDILLTRISRDSYGQVSGLVADLVLLDPTDDDKRQAREKLLEQFVWRRGGQRLPGLVSDLVLLDPTDDDKRQAREKLLEQLVWRRDGPRASGLVSDLVLLDPTHDDKRQVLNKLLVSLSNMPNGKTFMRFVNALIQLSPTEKDKKRAREIALRKLLGATGHKTVGAIARSLVMLGIAEHEMTQARERILILLSQTINNLDVSDMISGLVLLDPSDDDKWQVRDRLLRMMPDQAGGTALARLLRSITLLDPTEIDKCKVRDIILNQTDGFEIGRLGELFIQFDPTQEEKEQISVRLLASLPNQTTSSAAARLLRGFMLLEPTVDEKQLARNILVAMLPNSDGPTARRLIDGLTQLDPSLSDLESWRTWELPPTVELLAAARHNSTLSAWLAALPSLPRYLRLPRSA